MNLTTEYDEFMSEFEDIKSFPPEQSMIECSMCKQHKYWKRILILHGSEAVCDSCITYKSIVSH